MQSNDKWLANIAASEGVSGVAARAIGGRLQLVLQCYPLAVSEQPASPGNIHQLRVATRRAVAALDVFKPVLSRRRYRNLRNKLRRIRKRTGDARELDVLAQHLQSVADLPWDERQLAMATLLELRRKAQKQVVHLAQSTLGEKLSRRVTGILRSVHWRGDQPEPRFGEYSVLALTPAVVAYLDSLNNIPTGFDELHEFRIQGKRLRYSIELLASVWPKKLRTRFYPVIEDLQERLGTINDMTSAAAYCSVWCQRRSADAVVWERLRRHYELARDAARSDFTQWWNPKRATELRQIWSEILQRANQKNAAADDAV